MGKREFQLFYDEFDSEMELQAPDVQLLQLARAATAGAYAPYSRFRVGAAAILKNGQIVTGSNQENASYAAGICAEMTLLSVAAAQYPGVAVETMAISYSNDLGNSDRLISPCGICRQSLQEFEQRTGRSIRLVLGGATGKVIILERSGLFQPLAFSADELK